MSRSRSPEMSIPNKRRFRKVGTDINNEPIYEPFSDSEEESIQIENSQEGREKKNEKKEKSKTEKKAVTAKPAERKNGKKEPDNFDESNLSIDLTSNDFVKKKIKLSDNFLVESRVVAYVEGGRKYSYPAIVFAKRMRDTNKAFDFNIPLSIAPKLIKALTMITDIDIKL